MRLHVVALPHTQTTTEYLHCAYTQKIVKFTGMMLDEGNEVILYSGEENEARCDEHVALLSEQERCAWYGEWDANGLFGNVDWSPAVEPWQVMNARAVAEIRKRAEPQDFLCLIMGHSQKPIADALPDLLAVEWGVGYEGIALQHRVFESYAWMHWLYGHWTPDENGRAFDAVIPNFFDFSQFWPWDHPQRPSREDFLLFTGRLIARKGVEEAAEIAKRAGRRLVVAGPGAVEWGDGFIQAPEFRIEGDVEYVGTLGVTERADYMARAACALMPTRYIEPFGGVAVEAMMSGTPVVATDFGAFTETVSEGVSGYRFHTIREGVDAVERATKLQPRIIQDYALGRYSLEAVGPEFDRHFARLHTLWGEGYYA